MDSASLQGCTHISLASDQALFGRFAIEVRASLLSPEDLLGQSLFGIFLTVTSRGIFGGEFFVLFSDLVELFHVGKEVWASFKRDEKFGFLAITF